ncbi:28671_t:CDS:1, partial [Racocetra persica]
DDQLLFVESDFSDSHISFADPKNNKDVQFAKLQEDLAILLNGKIRK